MRWGTRLSARSRDARRRSLPTPQTPLRYRELLREILLNDVAEKAGLRSVLLEWFSEFYWPYKNEWDFKSKGAYFEWVEAHEFRTLNGDRVRSFEEWEISNWLYRHGVEFEYEPAYEHPLPADARGAYRPDFRLTESGVYIEHFGVRKARNADGSTRLTTAPYIDCDKYLADMEWKRQVHKANRTTLIETFSYEKVEGCLLQNLREKLAPYVKLAPLADDRVFAVLSQMGQVDAFTQTLGTFLRHFKSVGANMDQCRKRGELGEGAPRSLAFMKVFEFVFDAYQRRLGEQIDFEDMISRATAHIESGRYQSPYRHILVDEFQDISEGRAHLLRALKAQHADARIFAVGDDWQSIFRFAGSDIHLMRDFGKEFGGKLGTQSDVHSVVDLGRTFRSVDKIALPARAFVLKNPSQIEKQVIAAGTTDTPAIFVAYYDRGQDSAALEASLQRISSTGSRQTSSVLLLGRYNHLKPKNFIALEATFPHLSLRFMTAHGSKGLEADHVIILSAVSGTMGFPSEIVDDPLLELVLPMPERFEHAEERRLFYVALTRARASVTIVADREKPSVFVRELVENPEYDVLAVGDPGVAERDCPACAGRMLAKTDKNGRRYYSCEHGFLCGGTLRACSSCDQGLPAASETRPGVLVCSCGAEFAACPECDSGWLVERSGPYGGFLGCVRYPVCNGKRAQSGRRKN
jgi:DNA helicase-4